MRVIPLCILLFIVTISYGRNPAAGSARKKTMGFRENKGQVTDQYGRPRLDIQFRLAADGMSIFIGEGQLHYQFYQASWLQPSTAKKANGNRMPALKPAAAAAVNGYRMDVVLEGANARAVAEMDEELAERESYYGRTTAEARGFAKIVYKNIYPAIDWVLYFRDGRLKYDFIVHAGGRIEDIRIRYKGATALQQQGGSIVARTPLGSITEKAPYSYTQQTGRPIVSRFLLADSVLHFAVADYKKEETLVIDPELNWATYYGSTGTEAIDNGMTCDKAGNVYISGWTDDNGNIATSGSYQVSFTASTAAFLTKFNAAGQRQWATYYGNNTQGLGLSCDNDGNIYFSGSVSGDLDNNALATPGSHQQTHTNDYWLDLFLVKFNSAGARQWATYYGGMGTEGESAFLAYDSIHNKIYLAATTYSADQISSAGSFQETIADASGTSDVFLAQFNANGVRQWATYYGSAETGGTGEACNGICCDGNGDIYLLGGTSSTNILATPGSFQETNTQAYSSFLVKFNTAGVRQWATYFGDGAKDLVTDSKNNVYLTGLSTAATGIATPGSYQESPALSGSSNFIVKFNSAGIRQWGTYFGGEAATALSVTISRDSMDNVYIGGLSNQELITTTGVYQPVFGGPDYGFDGFIARFTAEGKHKWTSFYGGNDIDYVVKLKVLPSQHVLCFAGMSYGSATGITTTGSYQPVFGGGLDVFLGKFSLDPFIAKPVLTGDLNICEGEILTYSVLPVAHANSYTWTIPGGWMGSSISNTITLRAGPTGGSISVTANNLFDTSQAAIAIVTATPLPVSAIIATGEKLKAPAGFAAYQWFLNNEPLPGSNVVTYTASRTGDYTVAVTDANGCKDTSDMYHIELHTNLFVPNMFSPNGDGSNDVLKVYGNELSQVAFVVYNQWGQKLYETNDLNGAWDGSSKGRPQPVGVYMFTLRATLTSGEVITRKGAISLVR